MLTKCGEKKLDGNCTRMLQAILNKSWKQPPSKQQLYGYLSPILKTIQLRWTRHAGDWWRSKDELISNVLLWNPSHRWPARIYLQQICTDTRCSLEDLLEVMDGKRKLGKFVWAAQHDDDDIHIHTQSHQYLLKFHGYQ